MEDITVGANGQIVHTTRTVATEPARDVFARIAKSDPSVAAPARKISARLQPMLTAAAVASGRRIQVLVSFLEDQQIPRFPGRDQTRPATDAVNVAAQATSDALVRQLTAQREPAYQILRADVARLGGTVLGTYWLTKEMYLDLPVSAVTVLAGRPDVRYVEPAGGGEAPPGNDEAAARALMGTDPFFTAGRVGDRVAIIDTGVQASHTLLSGPSQIATGQDFTGENDTFTDACDHGTATAAVISGNGNFGNAYRGVGAIPINVYKVYPNTGSSACLLNHIAAESAFQQAVQNGEKVIVAEMQGSETENGGIAGKADAAFDAGAVVVAANGNTPGVGNVKSPANARKVLGIGAVDVQTAAPYANQSQGPTTDGRIKPDVVAPNNVDTASTASTITGNYGGTSAATAEAGGAAAVLRNFLRGPASDIAPGHVYAGMILGGSHPGSFFDNVEGAGKLKLSPLPPAGKYTKFSLTDTAGSSIGLTLGFTIPAGTPTSCRLSASLWWGEKLNAHNDFDLRLIDPNGTVRAVSDSAASVFELARVTGPLSGTWKIQVTAFRPVIGTQTVYGAVSTCR